jgi:hypothetical protein
MSALVDGAGRYRADRRLLRYAQIDQPVFDAGGTPGRGTASDGR